MNLFLHLNWNLWASLLLLIIFSELAAANFKRLSPVLEAWDQERKKSKLPNADPSVLAWVGGWEKLAVLSWALGSALPYIVFSFAVLLFVPNSRDASTLILGSTLGGNIVALSLNFGLLLSRGPLNFFRIRTVTSPVFLLFAAVGFSVACLDYWISRGESLLLLLAAAAYVIYFRRFSSEWKSHIRQEASASLIESAEGTLPIVAIFCLSIGFTVFAILFSNSFVTWMSSGMGSLEKSKLAVHIIAPVLALSSIFRALYSTTQSDSSKAITLTGIAHSCLLNTLFLCGIIALFRPLQVNLRFLRVDLSVLLVLTGIFVATLLIEKQRDRGLSWFLILAFLVYSVFGLYF